MPRPSTTPVVLAALLLPALAACTAKTEGRAAPAVPDVSCGDLDVPRAALRLELRAVAIDETCHYRIQGPSIPRDGSDRRRTWEVSATVRNEAELPDHPVPEWARELNLAPPVAHPTAEIDGWWEHGMRMVQVLGPDQGERVATSVDVAVARDDLEITVRVLGATVERGTQPDEAIALADAVIEGVPESVPELAE